MFLNCRENDSGVNDIAPSKHEWIIYSTETSAIPSDNVFALDFDNTSLWMATEDGFAKFDSQGWKIFNPSEKGWSNNKVYGIRVSSNGTIWITGNGFLTKIDNDNWTSYTQAFGYSFDLPAQLFTDINGILWYAFYSETDANFVNTFHFISFELDGFKDHTLTNPVRLILCSSLNESGEIVIAGIRNFAVYQDSIWVETVVPDSIYFHQISKIAANETGVIWLGTTSGVIRYDGYSWNNYGLPRGSDALRVLKVDKNGIVWCGFDGGVCFLNGNEWIFYDYTNSNFPSNRVTDIVFDENNDVWIGTIGGGILKIEK